MPKEVLRQMPINLQQEHAAYFEQSASCLVEEPVVIEMKRVLAFSNGLIWNGKLFEQSLASPFYKKKYNQGFLISCILKCFARGRLILEGKMVCLVVHDEWGFNYYHWLTGTLPRLYLVRNQVSDYNLLLPDTYRDSYHLYTLQRFGIKNVRRMGSKSICYAGKLCFPVATASASDFNPKLLRDAISYLVEGLNLSIIANTKMYISRKNTSTRRIINEPEVIAMLLSEGFTIFSPEDKSFEEQVRIFSGVKILVSIHGAGLANMMFMPAGGYVLEFRNAKNTAVSNNCYFNLSDVFDHRYLYQACEPDSDLKEQDANIYVDINELKANLSLLN